MCRRLLALSLLCVPSPSDGRAYGVEDLLMMESYGQVTIASAAGLLLVERRRPYRLAPDFSYGAYFNDRALGRILETPTTDPSRGLRPLFAQDDDAGYWMGTLSPSGRLLSVFRLQRRTLSLGIVDLRSRSVRWLDLRPDLPANAPAPEWIDDARLLVTERTDGRLPRILALGSAASERLTRLNRDQSRGAASYTVAFTDRIVPSSSARLVEVRADGSRQRTLLAGNVVDVALSPDRRTAAVVTADDQTVPPPTPIGVSYQSRRLTMSIVPIARPRTVVSIADVAPDVLAWSPGGRLLVIARTAGSGDWSRARVVAAAPDGSVHRLGSADDLAYAADPGDVLRFSATWIGRRALAIVRGAGGMPEWRSLDSSSSESLGVPASAGLAIRDGRAAVLAAGATRWIVDAGGATLLPASTMPLAAVSLEPFSTGRRDEAGPCGRIGGGTGRTLTLDASCGGGARPGFRDDVLAAHQGGLVVRRVEQDGSQVLSVLANGGAPLVIDRINEHLSALRLPAVRRLETTDRSGRRLVHWLLLPPVAASEPPHLVVQPYPGRVWSDRVPNEARPVRYSFGSNPLLLTSAGFAVLLPSMPRAAGRHPIEDVVPQVEAAVAAARETGLVRLDRYGVMGHSFGGWAAMVLATRAGCLAGVIAANGVYDLSAAHATMAGPDRIDLPLGIPYGSSAGWAESGQGALSATPWSAPGSYGAASPIMTPDTASADVLLLGGDLDPVDLEQTERMFMELGRSGRKAQLMRFWGEGHTVSSPDNLRAYWSTAISFLRSAAERARTQARCVPGSPQPLPRPIRDRLRSRLSPMPRTTPRT